MISNLAKKYRNIVVLSTGLGDGPGDFARYFPEKCFSFGRAHRNIVGACCGFVVSGKMPVVYCVPGFIERTFGELRDLVCEPNLNVKFVGEFSELDLALVGLLSNMEVRDLEQAFEEFGPRVVG